MPAKKKSKPKKRVTRKTKPKKEYYTNEWTVGEVKFLEEMLDKNITINEAALALNRNLGSVREMHNILVHAEEQYAQKTKKEWIRIAALFFLTTVFLFTLLMLFTFA